MSEIEIAIPSAANLQLADPSLLNFYKDMENRTYWLSGTIDESCFDLVQYIIRWNREDKGKEREARTPIRLIIDSPGGSLSVSETLSSIIQMSETPIIGLALGYVASGATMIFLSCHKRLALPNCSFVLHKGGCSGISGTHDEIIAFARDYEQQIKSLMEFYKTHTSYSETEITSNMHTDWYIRCEEAKDKNLIDGTIEEMGVFFE